MKPSSEIEKIPLKQYPFGDEDYLSKIFMFGYLISMVILISMGYESLILIKYITSIFDIFMFLLAFLYITCFHLALNSTWINSRMELEVNANPISPKEEEYFEDFKPKKKKIYTIWAPSQVKFRKFSILNIIFFLIFLGMLFLDLFTQTGLRLLELPIPRTALESEAYTMSLFYAAIFIIEPVLFIAISRTLYEEIYHYKIEKIAPLLVKIEPDDILREKVIKLLERIQDYFKFN